MYLYAFDDTGIPKAEQQEQERHNHEKVKRNHDNSKKWSKTSACSLMKRKSMFP